MTRTSSSHKVLILGATGLVGGAVFAALQSRGVSVMGTARKETGGFAALDLALPGSIESFPWEDFDVVVDCTGVILYDDTSAAREANMIGNVRMPLAIIRRLGPAQHYYYCSTHAVLAPEGERTTYAASKLVFEESVRDAEGISARVTIVRLPAIFSERRDTGLLHRIKEHFVQKKELELTVRMFAWHAMYLPRVAEVFSQLILAAPKESVITIGYPTETSFEKMVAAAESVFGYAIPVRVTSAATDHYVPALDVQQQYAPLEAGDFEEDLAAYLKK